MARVPCFKKISKFLKIGKNQEPMEHLPKNEGRFVLPLGIEPTFQPFELIITNLCAKMKVNLWLVWDGLGSRG